MLSMAAFGYGAMSDLVEARDFNGELYVSAGNLVAALDRAREIGADHERVRLLSMMTPHERRVLRVREACADAGLTFEELMTPTSNRYAKTCVLRQDLFLEFREEGMSLPEIGRFFKRDHTTVCHGIKVARERRNGLGNTGELRQAVKAAEAASAIRAADPDD